MGLCLDTEPSDESQQFEDEGDSWATPRRQGNIASVDEPMPMHNGAQVQFDPPKVPVVFVLGGPGSGKVTHCDNLMQEMKGITHINMTDLLQQYAVGNDMQDFSMLSSKTVVEVLMLEIKMAPNAKTYLVSGFPRSMRDVVEYSEKICTVNGVILISWRQKVLEKQIDYGAKLGQVVLSLAKMELNNFYKNVMPVAEYFDQSNMLISVNGERHPGEVYKDFREAVLKILGSQDNPPALGHGKEASLPVDVTTELHTVPSRSTREVTQPKPASPQRPGTRVISVSTPNRAATPMVPARAPSRANWPHVLWVLGGPGSNKASLCSQAAKEVGWAHISVGKLLRAAAEPLNSRGNKEAALIRDRITAGEMVPLNIVMKIVESHMTANIHAVGVILDGFPRDATQAGEFEMKFKQKPTVILLDCSKLQLGRGRLDDSVTAFRRRLEIFRQLSLPMLKAMDNVGRLTIVDGDTDTVPVQEDFKQVVGEHVHYLKNSSDQSDLPVENGRTHPIAADGFEEIETISKRVGNGVARGVANGVNHMANGVAHMVNGYGPLKAPPLGQPLEGSNKANFIDGHM